MNMLNGLLVSFCAYLTIGLLLAAVLLLYLHLDREKRDAVLAWHELDRIPGGFGIFQAAIISLFPFLPIIALEILIGEIFRKP